MALRRRHFWIFAGVTLLAGALLFALVGKEAPIPHQTLPDGTVISIPKVSYGKVHRYNPAPFWERIALKILPAGLKRKLSIRDRNIVISNSTDTTMIFVVAWRSNVTFSAAPAMVASFYTSGTVKDDAGSILLLARFREALPYSNLFVQAFQPPLVSHTATELRLALSHGDWRSPSNKPASTDFTVANPAPHTKQPWSMRPLPLTNTDGELTAELLDLENVETPALAWATGESRPLTRKIRARIRVLENGVTNPHWYAHGVTIYDEEGNGSSLLAQAAQSGSGLEFELGLSPREPRRFVFELRSDGPFDPRDTITLTNVLSSGPAASTRDLTLEFRGLKLQIEKLGQQNDFENINLLYHLSPPQQVLRHYIILKAVDAKGVETVLLKHDGGTGTGGNLGSGSSRPRGVGDYRVDLVFAVTKTRSIEFVATPGPLPEGEVIRNTK